MENKIFYFINFKKLSKIQSITVVRDVAIS
jgi:hypothetical protein